MVLLQTKKVVEENRTPDS